MEELRKELGSLRLNMEGLTRVVTLQAINFCISRFENLKKYLRKAVLDDAKYEAVETDIDSLLNIFYSIDISDMANDKQAQVRAKMNEAMDIYRDFELKCRDALM